MYYVWRDKKCPKIELKLMSESGRRTLGMQHPTDSPIKRANHRGQLMSAKNSQSSDNDRVALYLPSRALTLTLIYIAT